VTARKLRINPFCSLKTQLCLGAIALLTLTVASIGYFLIDQQRRILRHEIQGTVILQGRNIAYGGEEALLKRDAESELLPLVKAILTNSENVTSVLIADADGIIRGHNEPQNLSKPFKPDFSNLESIQSDALRSDETLHQSNDSYVFGTPIKNQNKTIGHVSLSYSKKELKNSMHRAVTTTLIVSAIALSIGLMLSLWFFRRISRPMGTLISGVREIGEGRYTTRIACDCKNEFQVLAESFNDMSEKIEDAQEKLVNKHKVDQELEIAREIQAALIPTDVPEPDGYQVAVHYKAASQVGGDYLDVIPIDPNNIAIIMADVSGKGVPGLVVMAMLKIMVTTLVARRTPPVSLIRQLNISMKKTLKPNMFVTFFVGYMNARNGRLVYSNAGHNPLVIYDPTKRRCEFHRMAGPPLGIFPPTQFDLELEEYELQMNPGTLILQYTDGLNESMNANGEQFSLDRIMSECKRNAISGAKTLLTCLVDSERKFRGSAAPADDIALLALGAKKSVTSEIQTHSNLSG
jgi:sigma-B regulation protein RsbU (phosphoserine phosphatase)